MSQISSAVLADLASALADRSAERRADVASRVTALLLLHGATANETVLALFDDVLLRLAASIETQARAWLAETVAPLPYAPPRLVATLAHDAAIRVAAPILSGCDRLDEATLLDCCATLGRAHLLALAQRRVLLPSLTDVLLGQGDRTVVQRLAANPGAQFSVDGYGVLVRRAAHDDVLMETIGLRSDLPRAALDVLVECASDLAVHRLIKHHPARAAEIAEIVRTIAADSTIAEDALGRRSYEAAQREIAALVAAGRLDDGMIRALALEERFEETVAALAARNNVSCDLVEAGVAGDNLDSVLIIGKAAALSWPTIAAILSLSATGRALGPGAREEWRRRYLDLAPNTARRIVSFYGSRPRQRGAMVIPIEAGNAVRAPAVAAGPSAGSSAGTSLERRAGAGR